MRTSDNAVNSRWIGSYNPATYQYSEHILWKIISSISRWIALPIIIVCVVVSSNSYSAWKDGKIYEYQPAISFDPSDYARFYVGDLTIEVKPNGGLILAPECISQPAPRESTAHASYIVLCSGQQAFYMLDSNDWGNLEIEAIQVIRAEVDDGSGQHRFAYLIAALVLVFFGVVWFLLARSLSGYIGKLEKYTQGDKGQPLMEIVNRLNIAGTIIVFALVIAPLFLGLLSVLFAIAGGVLDILF